MCVQAQALVLYVGHLKTFSNLLDLAELLVDAVVIILHVHCRREYLVLEFLGESMQAPVLHESDRVTRATEGNGYK